MLARSLVRLGFLAAAIVAGALPPAAAAGAGAGAGAGAPTVVISPLAGTPDANPGTQISFLGAPASNLQDIVVTGSANGSHSGRLRYYSTLSASGTVLASSRVTRH